jgi:pimeloyl-ACP methyl ester carboxylesterase
MAKVISKDGTSIAYDKSGHGPAVILVDGALCYRASGPMGALTRCLEQSFTVFTYDRRGRGESGDTLPYAVEREVEDIETLVKEAGGSAFVFGESSGGALALEAASHCREIKKIALYEAPYFVDNSRPPLPADFVDELNRLLVAGKRGEMVKRFMKLVDVPGFFIALMQLMPVWAKLKAVAHTLPYDFAITKDNQRGKPLTADRWRSVAIPTLVADGGKSPAWMRNGMQALAGALPNARYRTLEGQTHIVKAEVLAPVLAEFFQRN